MSKAHVSECSQAAVLFNLKLECVTAELRWSVELKRFIGAITCMWESSYLQCDYSLPLSLSCNKFGGRQPMNILGQRDIVLSALTYA